jgi:hypothetical protein
MESNHLRRVSPACERYNSLPMRAHNPLLHMKRYSIVREPET